MINDTLHIGYISIFREQLCYEIMIAHLENVYDAHKDKDRGALEYKKSMDYYRKRLDAMNNLAPDSIDISEYIMPSDFVYVPKPTVEDECLKNEACSE